MNHICLTLLFCLQYFLISHAAFENLKIVGYDTTGIHSKLLPYSRAISNVDVTPNCSAISGNYQMERTGRAQLLKLIKEPEILVTYCKVKWTMTTKRCDGFPWKYVSPGKTLFYDRFLEIPEQSCRDLITKGATVVNITGIPLHIKGNLGETTNQQHNIAGHEGKDGYCIPTTLTILGENEDKQVFKVTTATSIGISSGHYIPHLDQIIVAGGPRIKVNKKGSFCDSIYGQYYYNASQLPKDNCDHHRSIALGNLTIYEPTSSELDLQKVLNFETKNNLSLTVLLHEETTICGRLSFITSEPNIFITPLREKDQQINNKSRIKNISLQEVSRLDELNARISTLTLKMSMKMDIDINSIISQVCEARLESLKNYYNLLALHDGSTGLSLGSNQPGVEVINQGAVSFLIFGIKMEAKLRRNPGSCCEELPISVVNSKHNRSDVFLDPRTSVIMPFCTPRSCDAAMPYYYRVIENSANHSDSVIWLCTRGSPEVVTCDEPPLKKDVMSKKFKSKIQELMSRDFNKATIHSPELIHQHHIAKISGLAKETILAKTAQELIQIHGTQLPSIIGLHTSASGITELQEKVLSGFGSYFHDYIKAGYYAVGLILTLLVLAAMYKLWILLLKFSSAHKTKRFGFNLGSKRQLKAMRKNLGAMEEELVELKQYRSKETVENERIAKFVDELANRLSKVEVQ